MDAGVDKSKDVVKVILMPHSHNDPGWLYTYDSYYSLKTKVTFDNLVGEEIALSRCSHLSACLRTHTNYCKSGIMSSRNI